MSDLRYECEDGIATITFNRPEKLNAFTRAMTSDLVALLDRIDADDSVRAVILTGEGRAFCAGADLGAADAFKVAGDGDEVDWSDEATRDYGGFITLRLFECLKPVIVAFNGAAAGMGVTMALAADIRLASTASKFVFPFVRRGIVPESASAWFLPRIVGIGTALEWAMSGRPIPAEEALAARLVRSLHAPEDLLPAARAIARDIADNAAPVSVALTRQMLWRMMDADHPMTAHQLDSRLVYRRAASADAQEGVASFLEKRPPAFSDRVSDGMPDVFPWWTQRSYS